MTDGNEKVNLAQFLAVLVEREMKIIDAAQSLPGTPDLSGRHPSVLPVLGAQTSSKKIARSLSNILHPIYRFSRTISATGKPHAHTTIIPKHHLH